jgi:hypothetical protein
MCRTARKGTIMESQYKINDQRKIQQFKLFTNVFHGKFTTKEVKDKIKRTESQINEKPRKKTKKKRIEI